MSTVTKKMNEKEILALKDRLIPQAIKESKPNYAYYQIKCSDFTVTAYESGKVVFQGKDLSWLEEEKKEVNHEIYPQAGSDEVGTGDYFGPIVVCAAIVESKDVDFLIKLGVQDSKAINDDKIKKIAPEIEKRCPHSILIVNNAKYNQIHPTCNMVKIKCLLHNQAYVNLIHKGYNLPDFKIIDQFVQEKSYYRYLIDEKEVVESIHFETKAENKYLSVACASILARYSFLKYFDALEEKYQFHFEKGASNKVDACAKEFVSKYGKEELNKVAKLHFANTKKIGL